MAATDYGNHGGISSGLIVDVVLLGSLLASRLDELLCLRIEEIVIDVNYRSVPLVGLLGDPPTGSPFFIQTVSLKVIFLSLLMLCRAIAGSKGQSPSKHH